MVAMYTEILAELGVENIVACGYVGGLGAGNRKLHDCISSYGLGWVY